MVDLTSGNGNRVRAARKALVDMPNCCVTEILNHSRKLPPSERDSARELIHDIACNSHMTFVLAFLPLEEEAKLQGFREKHPRTARDSFSPDWARRRKTILAIRDINDEEGLAGPILIAGLQTGSKEMAFAAAHAAGTGRYKSDSLVDALCDVLMRHDSDSWSEAYELRGIASSQPSILAVTNALESISNKRAAPSLVALMLRKVEPDCARDAALARALAATKEKRAIPSLISMLGDTRPSFQWTNAAGVPVQVVTMARADAALMALVELTEQDPKEYGFRRVSIPVAPGPATYGFGSQEERARAIGQFKQWWDQNKGKPAYAGLKPLDLPK